MTSPAPPKQPFGLGTYLLVIIGIALVGGVAGAAAALFADRPGPLGMGLTAAFISVAMAIALAACVWWWRGIDEAAREAHKWAWWWGSTVGLCFAGVILLTLLYGAGDLGEAPIKSILMLGTAIVTGCQMVGYSVAWAAWWLRRR